jgi:hypothetical protein
LRWIGQILRMGHYTRVTQAVSRMNRKPGRKLEKLRQRLLETERAAWKITTVMFLGLTPLLTELDQASEQTAQFGDFILRCTGINSGTWGVIDGYLAKNGVKYTTELGNNIQVFLK